VSSISATLVGAEAEHVAQHEHRALRRREMLKADDERERDRLFGLVASLGSGRLVRNALEQNVRERLKPDRVAVAGRSGISVIRGKSSRRRRLARRASSERLVAIRYGQALTDARPSNCSRPRHAASSVS
jgi:hypothetical protein